MAVNPRKRTERKRAHLPHGRAIVRRCCAAIGDSGGSDVGDDLKKCNKLQRIDDVDADSRLNLRGCVFKIRRLALHNNNEIYNACTIKKIRI